MSEEIQKKSHKEVGEENKRRILDCYTDYIEANGKAPTVVYLAETVGLTKPVIYKHLKSLQLDEIAVRFKPRAISILEGVAKRASDGDVAAAKLILQLAFGWNEKKILETTNTNINKSIQFRSGNLSLDEIKKIVSGEAEPRVTEIKEVKYEEVTDDDE